MLVVIKETDNFVLLRDKTSNDEFAYLLVGFTEDEESCTFHKDDTDYWMSASELMEMKEMFACINEAALS